MNDPIDEYPERILPAPTPDVEPSQETSAAPGGELAVQTTGTVIAERPALDGVEIVESVPELRLVASSPQALAAEQARLANWCSGKKAEAAGEVDDLTTNIAIHKKNKWSAGALERSLKRAVQRMTFYDKLRLALEAGFHIVPNMACDVFAIRTDRSKPTGTGKSSGGEWARNQALQNVPQQSGQALGAGEGEYKNPSPLSTADRYADGNDPSRHHYVARAVKFAGEIEFPFSLARPEVLTATQEAMALKVFDELAAVPATGQAWDRGGRRGDPMIVGRIRKPWVKHDQRRDHVTFLVVWFLDTNTL